MRIQLNKLGLSDVDYSAGIEYFGVRNKTWSDSGSNEAYIVHFCKRCGAELFGKWIYHTIRFDPDTHDSKREKAKQNDPQQAKYIDKQYMLMEHAYKRYRSDIDAMYEEAHAIHELKVCPRCGSSLSHDNGFFTAFDFESTLVSVFESEEYSQVYTVDEFSIAGICNAMRAFRLKGEQDQASEQASAIIAQYEDTAPTQTVPGCARIKNQLEELTEYILRIVQTETNIVSLHKRLQQLYTQRIDTDRNAYGSTLQSLIAAKVEISEAESHLSKCRDTLALYTSKAPDPINLPMPKRPQKPIEPQYAHPGLFNQKRVLSENAALKEKYQQALYQYECDMDYYTQELESRKQQIAQLAKQQEEQFAHDIEAAQRKVKEAEEQLARVKKKQAEISAVSSEIATPEKARKALLDKEIQQAESFLRQAIHCKHQLYNYNIIFGKYRNLVALSTIYEYLMAGRCTALEGTTGAYNLYESELRANIIIGQLNSVLESLDTIKENQYMIYNAIQKVNSTLERLENTMQTAVESLSNIETTSQTMTHYMEKVAKNSDVIAHNTAVTAYYSKINAELTNALGYMVALS